MSDSIAFLNCNNSNSPSHSLYNVLKNCANLPSNETLYIEDYNDVCVPTTINFDYCKMISMNSHSMSGYMSSSTSYASDESFGDGILEEEGRISLAYENLRTIPRGIAEKFAAKTKFLDLSYNNFQNLSFLSFFEGLHTLILDRNEQLNHNSLPYMGNLKILWINNCEISNIKAWVQRIQTQCPHLEQLSIMGNPGNNDKFEYCTMANTINCTIPTMITANYREYILQVLPNLMFLDGISREKLLVNELTATLPSIKSENSLLNGISHNSTSDNQSQMLQNNRKKSPTLSFKEFFQLKRRKKSYQSSSTN